MAYNIILQAMSTLPRTNVLKKCKFSMPEKLRGAKPYYGQLEPVSIMMIKSGTIPDMILSLCTKETTEKKAFALEENPDEVFNMTAYEFYQERIKAILPPSASTVFQTVDIDESNINAGIVGAAKQILEVKAKLERECANAADKKIKLWVNTQGGFRDISLVLNAIVNLMSVYEIEIADIYSMPFGVEKEGGTPIESKIQNYQIFDFVVGMKEFLNYGRADTLENYYTNRKNQNRRTSSQEENLMSTMKKVADAIQMCDPRGFNDCLIELRKRINSYKESGEQFFDIFVEKVKEDYGILLSENYNTIDVVKWFRKKEFYQQALTYIESYVPKELVAKGILSWKYNKAEVDRVKKVRKQLYVEDANYLLFSLCNARTKDSIKMKKAFEKNIENGKFTVQDSGESAIVQLKKPLIGMASSERKKLFDFIDNYYKLKALRNQFNHMSEKEKRITKTQLSNIIARFELLGNNLYNLYQ